MAFAPLQIYLHTKDPIMSSLNVLASSLGVFLSGIAISRLGFIKSEGTGIAAMQIIPFFAMLVLLAVNNKDIALVVLFISSFLLALTGGLNSGFMEGYIGHAANGSQEKRAQTSAAIRSSTQIGTLIGLTASAPIAVMYPMSVSVTLCGVCYIFSALVFYFSPSCPPSKDLFRVRAGSYALLWLSEIRKLTVSHLLSAAGLSLIFGCAFFALNDRFHAKAHEISLYFILQMAGALAGSLLAHRFSHLVVHRPSAIFLCRVLYLLPIAIGLSASTAMEFAISLGLLSVVHSFSIPIWLGLFQEFALPGERRLIGTSRKSIVALVGVIGTAAAGFLYKSVGSPGLFVVSMVTIAISSFILLVHLKRRPPIESPSRSSA